ncbi:MAG TPA: hypothetical protein VMG55_02935 [Stellaceae bacterium]|nr:hypothetical protein [Stellaceae bacterium]
MRSDPSSDAASRTETGAAAAQNGAKGGRLRRIAHGILHEIREVAVPTLFFFTGFNLIVLTTNLLVAQYLVAVSNFMLATMAALVVGKAVLVVNHVSLIRRYDRAPLIRPILFKTAIYWVAVFLARLLERFVDFCFIEGNPVGAFPDFLVATFSWRRFVAISIWLLVLFLIYVTATEFSYLFGRNELRRLLFTYRPTELQLNRRQRVRELLRLSKLADEHTYQELTDPKADPHRQMLDVVRRLARA